MVKVGKHLGIVLGLALNAQNFKVSWGTGNFTDFENLLLYNFTQKEKGETFLWTCFLKAVILETMYTAALFAIAKM